MESHRVCNFRTKTVFDLFFGLGIFADRSGVYLGKVPHTNRWAGCQLDVRVVAAGPLRSAGVKFSDILADRGSPMALRINRG